MTHLYVVAPTTNSTHFAGIGHCHAVRGISGSGVFAFRKVHSAHTLAQALDYRLLYSYHDAFSEELISPYANVFVGQSVDIKHRFDVNEPLRNVMIGRVSINDLTSYSQATDIAVIVIDGDRGGDLVIADIISPEKDVLYTTKYLEYLYEKEKEY